MLDVINAYNAMYAEYGDIAFGPRIKGERHVAVLLSSIGEFMNIGTYPYDTDEKGPVCQILKTPLDARNRYTKLKIVQKNDGAHRGYSDRLIHAYGEDADEYMEGLDNQTRLFPFPYDSENINKTDLIKSVLDSCVVMDKIGGEELSAALRKTYEIKPYQEICQDFFLRSDLHIGVLSITKLIEDHPEYA